MLKPNVWFFVLLLSTGWAQTERRERGERPPSASPIDAQLAGAVVDVMDAAVPGADLRLVMRQDGWKEHRARSRDDGTFRFEGIGYGPGVLLVTSNGFEELVRQVEIGPDATELVRLKLKLAPVWGTESNGSASSNQLPAIATVCEVASDLQAFQRKPVILVGYSRKGSGQSWIEASCGASDVFSVWLSHARHGWPEPTGYNGDGPPSKELQRAAKRLPRPSGWEKRVVVAVAGTLFYGEPRVYFQTSSGKQLFGFGPDYSAPAVLVTPVLYSVVVKR